MLETKFIKVAQSGPTIDGREIAAQDLRDIAETYSPQTYEAVIWPEHERFWGNHGTVLATEARENGDVTELYAKLKPGWRFIEKNKDGQKLYPSIEIDPNFADTNKAYMSGIAITDSPASLGTERIKFFSQQRAQRGEELGEFYCSGIELEGLFDNEPTAPTGEEAEKLFTRLFHRVFGNQQQTTPPTNNEEEMNTEQFNQMLSATKANATAIEGLANQFTKIAELASKQFSQGGEEEDPEKGNEPKDTPETIDLAALAGMVTKLSSTVEGMDKKFNQALPGTPVPENPTPAEDAGII
ncbi:GPO family capsid scaffolding protein (plasmid) [Halodesulfovibrio aestuarii]|uniref:Phage capsid scaffolding protein (GPO) serine peptidase n=1 Tax=Halodesulfovibrio aestuarii TaxID=126333 RepID=A0A8G2FC89_9BACT|nr:GPO family capsid scaffolding protein [Halodesulfovibrio aestuarii]SHJ71878.1 Phage capsid scaffolding protein (GPO) serine peptidase [Halodesulfovibrio aestuarii]